MKAILFGYGAMVALVIGMAWVAGMAKTLGVEEGLHQFIIACENEREIIIGTVKITCEVTE